MSLLPKNTSLGDLRLVEVYAEHDIPCVFACTSSTGRIYVATWIAETEGENRWLYAPVSSSRLGRLRHGSFPLRLVFTQPDQGLVHQVSVPKSADRISEVKTLRPDQLSEAMLPLPDVTVEPSDTVLDPKAAELLKSTDDAEIVLDGDPVSNHAIRASFFGLFLERFQKLANALGQSIVEQPTGRAPLRGSITIANRLFVQPSFAPSSFRFRLRLPTDEEIGDVNPIENQAVLDLISQVLAAENPEAEAAMLASPRVRSHYSALLEIIAKNGASVSLRTRGNPFGISLSTQQARDRMEGLADTVERNHSLTGFLSGGSLESERFELRVGEVRYAGKVVPSAVTQMKGLALGSRVSTTIRESTTTTRTGDVRTSYVMMSVQAAPDAPVQT